MGSWHRRVRGRKVRDNENVFRVSFACVSASVFTAARASGCPAALQLPNVGGAAPQQRTSKRGRVTIREDAYDRPAYNQQQTLHFVRSSSRLVAGRRPSQGGSGMLHVAPSSRGFSFSSPLCDRWAARVATCSRTTQMPASEQPGVNQSLRKSPDAGVCIRSQPSASLSGAPRRAGGIRADSNGWARARARRSPRGSRDAAPTPLRASSLPRSPSARSRRSFLTGESLRSPIAGSARLDRHGFGPTLGRKIVRPEGDVEWGASGARVAGRGGIGFFFPEKEHAISVATGSILYARRSVGGTRRGERGGEGVRVCAVVGRDAARDGGKWLGGSRCVDDGMRTIGMGPGGS